jgi:hypothetical protein
VALIVLYDEDDAGRLAFVRTDAQAKIDRTACSTPTSPHSDPAAR